MLQRIAVCCSGILQCVAVSCSILQCVAVSTLHSSGESKRITDAKYMQEIGAKKLLAGCVYFSLVAQAQTHTELMDHYTRSPLHW